MSGVKGKDRLMLYTIRSAHVTFNFKGRSDNETFREFANACNLQKYPMSGGNNYAHPPQLATVKKYFDHYLEKTDFENPLDRFRELHRKLVVKLQTFCKPGVECIRGLILYFSYECGLLRAYDELYDACKYMNENSKWKINYSEYPEIPEEKIIANLANEELMLYTVVCFAYQTYRVSIKFSGMENAFEVFARDLCNIDRDYHYGPVSVNVPSFRTIRKSFQDFHPIYSTRPGPERVIRTYKMIEKEDPKGCKTAVHGLILFLSYLDGLLTTYEGIHEVALALTKYTRPIKSEEDPNVLANFDIDQVIRSLQLPQIPGNADTGAETDDDMKVEEDAEFFDGPSTSDEYNPSPFNIMQELGEGGNNNVIFDPEMEAAAQTHELIRFLANMEEWQMAPENNLTQNAFDLGAYKAEVEDPSYETAETNNINNGVEEDQNQIEAKFEVGESFNSGNARVVAIENIVPFDMNLLR